jgi:hypothetical protein
MLLSIRTHNKTKDRNFFSKVFFETLPRLSSSKVIRCQAWTLSLFGRARGAQKMTNFSELCFTSKTRKKTVQIFFISHISAVEARSRLSLQGNVIVSHFLADTFLPSSRSKLFFHLKKIF